MRETKNEGLFWIDAIQRSQTAEHNGTGGSVVYRSNQREYLYRWYHCTMVQVVVRVVPASGLSRNANWHPNSISLESWDRNSWYWVSSYPHKLPYCLWIQNPVLYQRFRHSVTSMISSPSLFRVGKMVNFVSLKIRSVSALITSIDSMSNVIDVGYVEPEFVHY